MGSKITVEKIDRMVEMYNTGLSAQAIAIELDSKAQTVTKYLRERGIEIRGPKRKLTEDDKIEICRLYAAGTSCPKIAEQFGVSNALVLRYLEQAGIDRRCAEDAHRKYPIYEEFFDNIDTEEKAYFLGFLYADGCNHKDVNYVSLGLEETDREILVKLASLIYVENPEFHVKIQDRTHDGKGRTAYFTINSKRICAQLEKLGCPQAKTFILTYPEWMSDNLHSHFIRGYFDGDGSISVNTKMGKGSSFKITSSFAFARSVKKIITSKVEVNMGVDLSSNSSSVYDARSNGDRQVEKITDWIYGDATIFMKRKHDIYRQLKLEIEKTNVLIKAGTQGYSKSILTK